MTADEYLNNIKKLDITYNQLIRELDRIDQMLSLKGISYGETSGHSSDPHRRERLLAIKVSIQEKIEAERDNIAVNRLKYMNELKVWLNPIEYHIIIEKYFNYRTWQEVSEITSYSERMCKIHNKNAKAKIENIARNCTM